MLIPIFLFPFLLLVFTPTSDAKQLEFNEDRAPKFHKGEIPSTKNKNLKETTIKEPTPDPHLAANGNIEKHSTKASSSDVSRQDFSTGTKLKEEKTDNHHSAALEISSKVDDGVGSSFQHDNVKEEVLFVAVHITNLFLFFFHCFLFLIVILFSLWGSFNHIQQVVKLLSS